MSSESELRILITAVADKAKAAFQGVVDGVQRMASHMRTGADQSKLAMDKVESAVAGVNRQVDELIAKQPTKTIDLHTAEARARLDEIRADLDTMQNSVLDVWVNDGPAFEALYKLDAQFETLKEQAVKINLEDKGALAKLDQFQAKELELRTILNKIPLDVLDEKGILQVERLKVAIDTLHDKIVTIGVVEKPAAATSPAAGAAKAAGGGRRMGALAAVGLSALPMVAPVAAAATNAVMGLASAFTSASAGVAGFGAVAISDLKSVFTASSALNKAQAAYATATTSAQKATALRQEKQALYGLDAAQVAAVRTLQTFEEKWQDFARSFQKPVFKVFGLALKGIETLMTDMKPVITASANAFITLGTQMDKALGSSDNKQFFNWLASTAGPAILAFGHATGNVFRGIANLMMAFGGSAKSMETGLVGMTADFYKWTDSLSKTKGFKEFLSYAASSGKAVLTLIGQLAQLVVHLITYLAPLGLELLKVVGDLGKWINQLLTTNPIIRILIHVVITAVKNLLIFVDTVIKVMMWLGKTHPVIMDIIAAVGLATAAFFAFNAVMDANPVALVIIGIAALVAAVVELVRHWHQVIAWLGRVWNSFRHLGLGVQFALAMLNPFIGIPALIIAHWRQISNFFGTIVRDVESGFMWLVNGAYTWGSNFINMFKNGILAGVHAVTSAVSRVARAVKSFLGFGSPTEAGPGATSDQWAPNFINMYVAGLQKGIPRVQDALRRVLEPGAQAAMDTGYQGNSPAHLGTEVAAQLTHETGAGVQNGGQIVLNMTNHIHGAHNFNDPHVIESLSQQIAIYTQQKLHAMGGTL
ncbi:hypothetical protein [Alicyclobacillus sp. SO9]|uniref:hypothetical protein n=1 Tax=Alicyclobacillus sp. SO9 TaxID=2665646 RepID=UPI0018E7C639|nr:hypothetical protein [Alicyclobacillus sp. SO9]QQE80934.1 hypothetical protein GI364_11415 [Alicyclobacillus sp. SO9]